MPQTVAHPGPGGKDAGPGSLTQGDAAGVTRRAALLPSAAPKRAVRDRVLRHGPDGSTVAGPLRSGGSEGRHHSGSGGARQNGMKTRAPCASSGTAKCRTSMAPGSTSCHAVRPACQRPNQNSASMLPRLGQIADLRRGGQALSRGHACIGMDRAQAANQSKGHSVRSVQGILPSTFASVPGLPFQNPCAFARVLVAPPRHRRPAARAMPSCPRNPAARARAGVRSPWLSARRSGPW